MIAILITILQHQKIMHIEHQITAITMFDKRISNINDLAHKYNYKQEKQNTRVI